MDRIKTLYINAIKEYCFLDTKYIAIKAGEYEVPFAIQPTKGKHNLQSCEGCRKQREILIEEISEAFDKFPKCCEYHEKLLELDAFKLKDYKDMPSIIADKVMFTFHHIINNLDNDDWYEDIADYLEYNMESFGSLPIGYGEPFKWSSYVSSVLNLLSNIESKISSKTISNIEIKTRMNKVKNLFEPVSVSYSKNDSERDFNLLMTKYDEWYKIFPFDLPYFLHLKEKFKRTLPIYTGRTRHNKYLKTTKRELHTKDSFTAVLLRVTKNIITSINGLSLYEKGLISDTEKHKIDLIVNNRKLELFELSSMPNTNKSEYVKILKRWFKEEKEFINEITPLLNVKNSASISNSRPNRTDIAYFCYYTSGSKELKTSNSFPSKKAWKEIGNRFGRDDTNIQKMYNTIYKSSDERLKETKRHNIEYVIKNMLSDYPKAIILAKKELIKTK